MDTEAKITSLENEISLLRDALRSVMEVQAKGTVEEPLYSCVKFNISERCYRDIFSAFNFFHLDYDGNDSPDFKALECNLHEAYLDEDFDRQITRDEFREALVHIRNVFFEEKLDVYSTKSFSVLNMYIAADELDIWNYRKDPTR